MEGLPNTSLSLDCDNILLYAIIGLCPKIRAQTREPIQGNMRQWGVLAVSDYVRADWEDDMEPGGARRD